MVLAFALTAGAAAVTAPSREARAQDGVAASKVAARGIAVLGLAGATDAAAALAREVYASPALRPALVDDARARILAGEKPASTASKELRDLSDTVAAIKGDDAPSKALLASIAQRLQVRAIVVVEAAGGKSSARVFVAETGELDAARYEPDASGTWTGATQSLTRSYAAPAAAAAPTPSPAPVGTRIPGPSAALREGPRIENAPPGAKKFYESPWFWGAIGAAAFAGGAVYFATRDNSAGMIHLQLQVPK